MRIIQGGSNEKDIEIDHDIQHLNREIGRKEGALYAEQQKEKPDQDKIARLRQELNELEHRYERQAGFDND